MSPINLQMISIDRIKRNPLNPRKNVLKDTVQLQNVIQKNGWETAITCYEKNDYFIILSGHRRFEAAKQLKFKQIPVYVVAAPQSLEEELERLSSVQGGKEDWTTYEWGKYLFNLSKNNYENWTLKELSYKTGKGLKVISEALKVFNYFPHHQIEQSLLEKKLSITSLARIVDFINRLKIIHPDIIESLTEELIKTSLIYKAERKKITYSQLVSDHILETADKETLKKFFRTPKMKYSEVSKLLSEDNLKATSKIQRTLKTIQVRSKEIEKMAAKNESDKAILIKELNNLLKKTNSKTEEISIFLSS